MSNDHPSSSNNKDGPDFIGYYRDLFDAEISAIEVEEQEQPASLNSDQYFSNCLGGGVLDCKKAKLASVLHDAAALLHREADALLEKIVAKFEVESNLRLSCSYSSRGSSTSEASLSKKRKVPPAGPDCSDLVQKVYRDIRSLNANGDIDQEAIEKYSSDLLDKLCMMEQGVEEFINAVVVNCRPMTSAEKQQLGKRIQKLPEKAYDRFIEIFQSRNPFSRQNSDSVAIDLEKKDDATLWRLYYYVEIVLRASKT